MAETATTTTSPEHTQQGADGATQPEGATPSRTPAATPAGGAAQPQPEQTGPPTPPVAGGQQGQPGPGEGQGEAEAGGGGGEAGGGGGGGAPGSYELKLPEGAVIGEQAIERTATLARELGLSNEQAQTLLERENEAVSQHVQAQEQQWSNQTQAWVEQVKQDEEIGGDQFDASISNARKVIDRFGTDTLKQELQRTGLGNHPELVRLLARVGGRMGEDTLERSTGSGAACSAAQDHATILYGGGGGGGEG